MQYRLFTDMTQMTETDVARLQALAPPARVAYAMRYKHLFGRWTTLKAWELVYELTGIAEDWLIDPNGKPYFAHGPYFSISHCKTGVAAAIADTPVGIDIEAVRHVDEALIAHTMNDAEQALIHADADPDRAFTRLWTKKEAVLKCLGTGITSNLQNILTTHPLTTHPLTLSPLTPHEGTWGCLTIYTL